MATYSFTLDLSEYGYDQNNIILTTIQYTDYLGNKVTDTFGKENGKRASITSHPFTRLPGNGKVVVTESVRSGLSYDKESYDLGLKMDFSVTSTGRNGKVISSISTQNQSGATVKPANLSRRYPKSITFVYNVDKNGTVTVRQE